MNLISLNSSLYRVFIKSTLINTFYIAYNAILAFLDATDIDLRVNNNEREEEEAYNQDSWDLESLNSSRSSMKSS
jgi:hypothetical protein